MAAGPLAGGLLVEAFDWRAIFLVNLPIGAALLLAALPTLTESRNPDAPAIDVPGTVLSILGVGALTYGLIEGGAEGWTSPVILACFAAALVVTAAFIAVEGHRNAPMMPLRLFRNRLFTVSNAAMLMVGFSLMGSVFFFSQFFVVVQGGSILGSGLKTLPISLGMALVSPFAAAGREVRLPGRGHHRPGGGGRGAAGTGLRARGHPYGNTWWRLAVSGAGFALAMSPLTGAAIQGVGPREGGLASGISSTARQIGAVLGVAVLGAIVLGRQSRGVLRGRPRQRLHHRRRRHLGHRGLHRPVAGQVPSRADRRPGARPRARTPK
ncbi:MFS transporter [Streptomyces nogalater]